MAGAIADGINRIPHALVGKWGDGKRECGDGRREAVSPAGGGGAKRRGWTNKQTNNKNYHLIKTTPNKNTPPNKSTTKV